MATSSVPLRRPGRLHTSANYEKEIWLYRQLEKSELRYGDAVQLYRGLYSATDASRAEKLLDFVRAAHPTDDLAAARLAIIKRDAELINAGLTVRPIADEVRKKLEGPN